MCVLISADLPTGYLSSTPSCPTATTTRPSTARPSRRSSRPTKFTRPGISSVSDLYALSFVKALLEEFDASSEEYKPVGTGAARDCGKFARYLKDVLEGALRHRRPSPATTGGASLQGLSATDKQTLWRTARWYIQLVELTLPEDEEGATVVARVIPEVPNDVDHAKVRKTPSTELCAATPMEAVDTSHHMSPVLSSVPRHRRSGHAAHRIHLSRCGRSPRGRRSVQAEVPRDALRFRHDQTHRRERRPVWPG